MSFASLQSLQLPHVWHPLPITPAAITKRCLLLLYLDLDPGPAAVDHKMIGPANHVRPGVISQYAGGHQAVVDNLAPSRRDVVEVAPLGSLTPGKREKHRCSSRSDVCLP